MGPIEPTVATSLVEHEKREQKTSKHLQNYVCYTAQFANLSSNASLVQKVSLGKPYAITNYVTCNNFFYAHRYFLVAANKIMGPKFFYEVVKDPKCREAMAKEIEALELNQTWSIVDLLPGCKHINYE